MLKVRDDGKLYTLEAHIKDRLDKTSYYAGEIECLKERIDQLIVMVTALAVRVVEQNHTVMSPDEIKDFIGHGYDVELVIEE